MVLKAANYIVILAVLLLILGIAMVNAGFDNSEGIDSIPNVSLNISEEMVVHDCSNLSLEKSAKCLRDHVKTFYRYTPTDDGTNLSFQDLVSFGGDCRDYSLLYERLSNKLGFKGEIVRYDINDSLAHVFFVMHDSNGYCSLDQAELNCVQMKR